MGILGCLFLLTQKTSHSGRLRAEHMKAEYFVDHCHSWLSKTVFPLWIKKGIEPDSGSFIESLFFNAEPENLPKRAMVQARQIYSFTEALKRNWLDSAAGHPIIEKSTGFLLSR